MKIIKVDATNSTNLFLKEFIKTNHVENFTIISAEYQFKGKGQGVNIWQSKKGKNLLFSMLVCVDTLNISKQAYLNFAISLGIYNVLKEYYPKLNIKWPNDIMADSKKICGILIENTVKGKLITQSIVGVGFNVNQLLFPKELPNAISLANLLSKKVDRDALLLEIQQSIIAQINLLNSNLFDKLKVNYENKLFKNRIISKFKRVGDSAVFFGSIVGVTKTGLLKIKFEDDTINEYANKEIEYL